jgi:hypothetical protein
MAAFRVNITEMQASKLRNKVFGVTFVCGNIQGDSGGKVNILEGDSVDHCEEKRGREGFI